MQRHIFSLGPESYINYISCYAFFKHIMPIPSFPFCSCCSDYFKLPHTANKTKT